MASRKDEKYRQQIRNAIKAKDTAIKRLIELHRDEFDRIHAEEAEKLGVTPQAQRRKAKIERLKEQVAKLEGQSKE